MVLTIEEQMINELFKNLADRNHRDKPGGKGRMCFKCAGYFKSKHRVDCVDDKGREVSFCFKCYDRELKKPDLKI